MASFPVATSEKGILRNFVSCNFIKKETLAQVFSCEFFEIYKNTFFTEHLRRLLLLIEQKVFARLAYLKHRN